MTSDDAVVAVIHALNEMNISYLVTGSLASNSYGVARSTKDADFVLRSAAFDFGRLRSLLGADLSMDPQMSFETVTATSRYVIKKLSGEPFTIKLFFLTDDSHDQERFKRRRESTILGKGVWLPTPEDVVIAKLRWSKLGKRTKDTDDARNVIAVQANRLDWEYIHRWCDEHGTRELLEQVRASIPDDV